MSNVIHIEFFTDLRTNDLNQMRFRMEMCQWKSQFRKAQEEGNFEAMDQLNLSFDMVGLP